jgi:septum formation inhibitor-activating ATPase MinD
MGHLSPEEVTKRLGLEFDHIVPYESGLIVAANVGEPFVLKQKAFNSFTKSIERIADEISIRSVSTVFGTDPRIAANGRGKG